MLVHLTKIKLVFLESILTKCYKSHMIDPIILFRNSKLIELAIYRVSQRDLHRTISPVLVERGKMF